MRATSVMPITTRGIGINLCSFYADVVNLLPTETKLPKIYATYRALLALVESRFLNLGPAYHTSVKIYDYSPLLRCYYDVMNIPVIFKRLLEAINIVQYRDIKYFPAMSQNTYIDGNFIPRPENIILSNLGETVKALKASDVDDDEQPTLLRYRKNFYKNNPIPGAIWNQNYGLMNADDIISPNYDLHNDVFDDLHSLLSLSIQLKNYSNYINKDCTNRKVTSKRFSSFICNEMGDLRVPDRGTEETLCDYYCHSRPENDINSFYSRFRLIKNYDIKEGALFLLGEYPNDESVAKPVNELRSEHVNSYFYYNYSHKTSYLSYQSDILARSLQDA